MNLTSSEKCLAAEKLIQRGQFEDAGFLLDQVLESHPQHTGALVAKSALQLKGGQVGDAKRLLQAAYQLDPHDPVVLTNLANLALFENRLPETLEYLKTVNDLHPGHLPAVLLLGQISLQQGDVETARSWMTRAAKLGPRDPAVLVARSSLALSSQNLTEAAALLDTALDIAPDHVRALAARAHVHALAGDLETAGTLAAKAHLQAPQEPDVAVTLARVYLSSGALAEAQKLMDRFKVRYPDFAPVVLCAAEIAIARGKGAEALAESAKWLRKAPRDGGRIAAFLRILKMAGAWQQLLDLSDKFSSEVVDADAVQSLREEALHALGRSKEGWASWARRRALPDDRPRLPLHIAVPPRTLLLDELVFMRFVNAWAGEGKVDVLGASFLEGIWQRLPERGNIRWNAQIRKTTSDDTTDHPTPQIGLLADLAARTVLHAPDHAAFQPYLSPDPDRRAQWQAALPQDGKPLIGVFWDARAPGLLLDHLREALSDLPLHPVSLQFDDSRHQLRAWPDALDAGKALTGMGDLVNLVDCVDLVVGPDGLPLHVAGALGKRGLALLQENHEWYWAGQEKQSLWYPSIDRILTPVGPDWGAATLVLRDALAHMLADPKTV